MWLFLIFVAVPIIEISLFVTVGGVIGLWSTLAIVVLTAIIGTQLMRRQGLMTLGRLQTALAEGKNPTDPIAQGAMILIAGVLLLTPGFFTDAIGLLLLLAPVRVGLIRWASGRISTTGFVFTNTASTQNSDSRDQGDIIDAEYDVLDESATPRGENPSGWTKH